MIRDAAWLIEAAQQAQMKIPEDVYLWWKDENARDFPHFFAFCLYQLGRPVPRGKSQDHFVTAREIVRLTEQEILEMDAKTFIQWVDFSKGELPKHAE